MQAVLLQDEGSSGLAELLAGQQLGAGGGAGTGAEGPSTSAAAAAAAAAAEDSASGGSKEAAAAGGAATGPGAEAREAKERIDKSYFESYSFFDIHREMLGDKVGGAEGRGVVWCG